MTLHKNECGHGGYPTVNSVAPFSPGGWLAFGQQFSNVRHRLLRGEAVAIPQIDLVDDEEKAVGEVVAEVGPEMPQAGPDATVVGKAAQPLQGTGHGWRGRQQQCSGHVSLTQGGGAVRGNSKKNGFRGYSLSSLQDPQYVVDTSSTSWSISGAFFSGKTLFGLCCYLWAA